jgi:hypothetical protein
MQGKKDFAEERSILLITFFLPSLVLLESGFLAFLYIVVDFLTART